MKLPTIDKNILTRWLLLAGLSVTTFATAHAAYTWHDIQFGGFASQGYLQSSSNNYIGDTSGGTFNFREYGVDASWTSGKWRIGAQAFGQNLGDWGKDRIKLDWASVDYQATQWFGLRAGRVKTPHGLYNEALDLDAVRPFILLPQSTYDPRLRDFNAAFNGAMAYGNVELNRLGSVDYRVFYGDLPVDTKSGANSYFNNSTIRVLGRIWMDSVEGFSLFWNLPVDGLKVGYSYSEFKNLSSLTMPAPTTTSKTNQPYIKEASTYPRHLFSAEYIKGDWVFAAEFGHENAAYLTNTPPGLVNLTAANRPSHSTDTYGYFAVSRRITSWLQLGAYYDNLHETFYTSSSTTWARAYNTRSQQDYALSTRFDVTDHIIIKVEGHYYDGAGKVWDTYYRQQSYASLKTYWTMVAAKVTFTY